MTSCFPESHRRLEPLSIIHAMPEVVEAGASIYIMAGLIRDLPSMLCPGFIEAGASCYLFISLFLGWLKAGASRYDVSFFDRDLKVTQSTISPIL